MTDLLLGFQTHTVVGGGERGGGHEQEAIKH